RTPRATTRRGWWRRRGRKGCPWARPACRRNTPTSWSPGRERRRPTCGNSSGGSSGWWRSDSASHSNGRCSLSASSTDLRSEGRALTPPLSVELRGRRWVLALVLVVLTGACTVWVINSPVFRLRDLRVEGARHLSLAEVRRLAGLTDGTNVVWTSGSRVAERLERNPWVRSAPVRKGLPAGM